MVRIDPSTKEKFEDIVENKDPLNYWSQKLNPKLEDMYRVKKATLLSIASTNDKHGDRGRIHVLLEGEPGTGKSDLGLWLKNNLGAEFTSHRTTDVGLTGNATGKEITPGALPRADGDVIIIDELDEFKDRSGLLESLSDGIVKIEAGGMSSEFQARVRAICLCNRSDSFAKELLDRFDFHIELETPSEEEIEQIQNSTIDSWFKEKPGYRGRKLYKYLQWIDEFSPSFPETSRKAAKQLSQIYISEKTDTDVRETQSLIRVAQTLAKLEKSDIQPIHFARAILLIEPSLRPKLSDYAMNGGSDEARQVIEKAINIEGKIEQNNIYEK